MWTPPKPVINIPQTVVDFVTLLKDPKWLEDLVSAANAITQANGFTEEQAKAIAVAEATIAAAKEVQIGLTATRLALDTRASNVTHREFEVTKREKLNDTRNTELASAESDMAKRLMAVQDREDAVTQRETEARADDEAQMHLAGKLTLREVAVTDRENALKDAAARMAG